MSDLERAYGETLKEAMGLLELPRLADPQSPELEGLKEKYGNKLREATVSEEEIGFCLTKLLAPLIEGRQAIYLRYRASDLLP